LTSESAANRAVSLSRCAVATKDAWRDLVLHVDGPFVEPVSIQVEGDAVGITNPNGMISEGTGSTTVRTSGWHATRAIVDLGRVAMGYVEIGVLLAVVTAAEVALFYADIPRRITIPSLLFLTAVKFLLVVMWFMHLRFDRRLLTWVFVAGLAIAGVIFSALAALTLL
jgi:heme/copper-type cytochrome/quinol oxidase subunit 4